MLREIVWDLLPFAIIGGLSWFALRCAGPRPLVVDPESDEHWD